MNKVQIRRMAVAVVVVLSVGAGVKILLSNGRNLTNPQSEKRSSKSEEVAFASNRYSLEEEDSKKKRSKNFHPIPEKLFRKNTQDRTIKRRNLQLISRAPKFRRVPFG